MTHDRRIGIAGALCALLLGSIPRLAAGRAAADEAVGWGPERDGLQARLSVQDGRGPFAFGDSVAFALELKNVGSVRKTFRLRGMRDWMATAHAGSAVTLDPMPAEDTLTIDLPPGGVQSLAVPSLRLEPIGWVGEDEQPVLRLLPGRYTVRCPMPFWVPDEQDGSRATGLRAVPGNVAIEVIAPQSMPTPRLLRGPIRDSRVNVAWGEAVDGLQLGIACAGGRFRVPVGGAADFDLLIRNISDAPLTIRYSAFQVYDWHPIVTDSEGRTLPIPFVFVGGMRPQLDRLLQPGEAFVIGHPSLRILAPAASDESMNAPPAFEAPGVHAAPGRYRISQSLSIKLAGNPRERFFIALTTAPLPFEITSAP